MLPGGRVAYALKKAWRDGMTHVVTDPQVLIERLLALVPRPRKHLVTYRGVLAPGASMRSRIVPRVVKADEGEKADDGCADTEEAHAEEVTAESGGQRVQRQRVLHRPGKRRRGGLRYYTWAELRAEGVWRGRADMPALRRSKAATGRDPGPGFD
jgi:hypothetical protein